VEVKVDLLISERLEGQRATGVAGHTKHKITFSEPKKSLHNHNFWARKDQKIYGVLPRFLSESIWRTDSTPNSNEFFKFERLKRGKCIFVVEKSTFAPSVIMNLKRLRPREMYCLCKKSGVAIDTTISRIFNAAVWSFAPST